MYLLIIDSDVMTKGRDIASESQLLNTNDFPESTNNLRVLDEEDHCPNVQVEAWGDFSWTSSISNLTSKNKLKGNSCKQNIIIRRRSIKDANSFLNAKEAKNNLRWKEVASTLDNISRVIFPIGFSILLSILFY